MADRQSGKDAGANVFSQAGAGGSGAAPVNAGAITTSVDRPKVPAGAIFTVVDQRKWGKLNLAAAKVNPVDVGFTSEREMTVEEAAGLLQAIFSEYDLDKRDDAYRLAFARGLFLQYAVNAGSQVVDGAAEITVGEDSYPVGPALRLLGTNPRRFFRVYADDVREAVQWLLARRTLRDPSIRKMVAEIERVAANRGLHRYPTLCFDAADACTNLTHTERSVLSNSKSTVLPQTVNSVDPMFASDRAATADGYDSTNRTGVAGLNRAGAGRRA